MNKTCLKCGHANPSASGDPLEACPSCGAIYSRVEAAWGVRQNGASASAAAPAPAPTVAPSPAAEVAAVGEFAVWMRLESLYPTFRSLVELVYWVWVVLAVVCFAGALVGAWNGVGAARVRWTFFGGLVLGHPVPDRGEGHARDVADAGGPGGCGGANCVEGAAVKIFGWLLDLDN
jgi:hypothetical protein